jgi:hypothetical protein
VLSLGGKVVSLYPDLTVGEIEYLLNDSQAVYFVGQDQEQIDKGLAVLGSVPTLRRLIYWDDTGMWSYRQPSLMKLEHMEDEGRKRNAAEPGLFDSLVALGQPDDIAILSYTSGTTGRPKGVIITHRYLIDNAHRLVNGTDLTPGMDYLTYIAPAWVTEQLFGVTIGVTLPLVVNFPESPEQVLANLRELAVEAANGAASAESRALIAIEVRQRLEGLLTLANQQEPNGQYLFAGFSTQTRPFAPTPGGIQYNGDQGQRLLQIGPNRYVADGDPGSRVFQMARNGDGVMTVGVGSSNVGTAVVGGRGLADPAQWDGGTYQVVFTAPDAYEVRDAGNAVIATGAYVSGGSILFRGVKLEVSGTPVAGDSFSVGPSALQDIFIDRVLPLHEIFNNRK